MRTQFRRALVALTAVGLACAGLGVGSSAAAAAKPVQGGSLTYSYQGQFASSMDALAASTATGVPSARGAGNYYYTVYGALMYEDWKSGKVVPWMAKSMTMTDATHWVLTTHDGMKFSNGEAFDAATVKFSWQKLIDVATTPEHADALIWFQQLDVANPTTLNITLKTANTDFGRTVARNFPFVVAPGAYAADPASFARNPIGAGPFVVKTFDATSNLELGRNTTYYDAPKPYLDSLTILNGALDDTQRYNTFASGQAQMMNQLTAATYPLAVASGAKIVNGNKGSNGGSNFMFNTQRAPFNDVSARIAFETAIDSKSFNEVINGDAGTVQTAVFAKESPYYDKSGVFPVYDPTKAQKMFDDYAAKTGGPMKIALTIPTSPTNVATGNYLLAQFAAYKNVQFSVNSIAAAVYVVSLIQGNFDVAVFNITNYDPVVDFQQFYSTGGNRNFGKYSNPAFDALVPQAYSATTQADKIKVVDQMQKIVVDDGVLWYAWQTDNSIVYDPKVIGALPYAVNGVFLWDRVWVKKA